jgi:hypothetical protein
VRVRNTIFDSSAERGLFTAIAGSWEPDYRVYPHLPFSNLIDLDPQRLAPAEISFLHKTSVDYTLTDASNVPLLSLEFDGLGQGYSHGPSYIEQVPSKRDPNRAWKLGLKCRVANAIHYPLLVISYDEGQVLDPSTNITIVHGIVGSFIARSKTRELVAEMYEENMEWINSLPPDEQQEQVQDLVFAAEIEADSRWNPVFRRSMELSSQFRELDYARACSWEILEDPPRPSNCYLLEPGFDSAAFKHWRKTVQRYGCRYTLETSLGRVERTIWLRNFEAAGMSPFGMLEDVGELVTRVAAIELLRAAQSASRSGDEQ